MTITSSIARSPLAARMLIRLMLQSETFPFQVFVSRDHNAVTTRSGHSYHFAGHVPRKSLLRQNLAVQAPQTSRLRQDLLLRPIRGRDRVTKWPGNLRHSRSRGLINPGNYYYRRSLLQCLLHLPAFFNFLNNVHEDCDQAIDQCVICAMKTIFERYWDGRNDFDFPVEEASSERYYGAVEILDNAVENCCPADSAFWDYATQDIQGDPHEFLTFLHGQFAMTESPRSKRLDQLLTMKHTARWTCEDCDYQPEREQESIGLALGIRKNVSGEKYELTDYIDEFHNDSISWKCDRKACEAGRQIDSQLGQGTARVTKDRQCDLTITQAPEILTIQFKRKQVDFVEGQLQVTKIDDDIPYPEELDLSEFNEKGAPLSYRLYGVVAHSGSADGGHYIAAVRRKDDGFVTISDETVRLEGDDTWEELELPTFKGTPFDPVVLFYLKV